MMPPARPKASIPLFDRRLPHSFVPTSYKAATARSGGPRRLFGRRSSALPWTGASLVAGCFRLGAITCDMVFLAALAVPALAGATAKTLPSHASPTAARMPSYAKIVAEASQRFGLPAHWISAVIAAESGGDDMAASPKGALGLMQIMPATWQDLRSRYRLGANPFDRRDNILGGTAYLRELYDRYGASGFLAAYNAGPARYRASLTTGRPLGQETRAYLRKLAAKLPGLGLDASLLAPSGPHDWRSATLFGTHTGRLAPADLAPFDVSPAQGSQPPRPALVSRLTPQSTGLFASIEGQVAP